MNLFIGLLIVMGSVLGGFAAMGGNLAVLWQPWELVMIIGAALGAYIIANPKSVIRDTLWSIIGLMKGRAHSQEEYLELFAMLYMLFRQGKDNLGKLEKDFDDPMNSKFFTSFPHVSRNPTNVRFLADYFRLVLLDNQKSHELESLLDTEIESIEADLYKVPNALLTMADSLPAVGIVAAVLGVIKAMGAISEPPEVLGALIGGALVGTFLGVLLSYGFVGPLGNAVRARREQELTYYIAIKTALIAHLNGYKPEIAVEYGRKTINSLDRPVFEDVEQSMRETALKVGMEVK
jgi:chemotaxis protein MotA